MILLETMQYSGVEGKLTLNYNFSEDDLKTHGNITAAQLIPGDKESVVLLTFDENIGDGNSRKSARYTIDTDRLVDLIIKNGEQITK